MLGLISRAALNCRQRGLPISRTGKVAQELSDK